MGRGLDSLNNLWAIKVGITFGLCGWKGMQLCLKKTEKGGYLENNFAVIVGDALHVLCHVIF